MSLEPAVTSIDPEYPQEIMDILAKEPRDWSRDDYSALDKLNRDGHRERLQKLFDDMRRNDG